MQERFGGQKCPNSLWMALNFGIFFYPYPSFATQYAINLQKFFFHASKHQNIFRFMKTLDFKFPEFWIRIYINTINPACSNLMILKILFVIFLEQLNGPKINEYLYYILQGRQGESELL